MYRSTLCVAFLATFLIVSLGSAAAAETGGALPPTAKWPAIASWPATPKRPAISDLKNDSDSSLLLLGDSIETRLIDSSSPAAQRERLVSDSQSFLFARPSLSEVTLAGELEPAGILVEIMTHQQEEWHRKQPSLLFEPMAWDGFMVGGL